uniref:Anaphase-promoting complex subunit 4 WD40 domain-containing protein n=2 Tax=Prasinoderma coloniale TaxID=156133 RepID=A0A7R9TE72_9VIRI|mmetsp:Transcript_13232/g.55449  ORF Transcript_13232/g.55449 Transcript_13232/m.55449 type:complete len:185 (+) Transcript_13232:3-557(+)
MLRAPATPCAAFDEQGLVMGVAMEGQLGGNMELMFKLYDVRMYGKGPFDTFRLAGTQSAPTHVCFSPDGALVLLCTKDGSIALLDAFKGEQRHLFQTQPPEDDTVRLQACFSPDGKYVLCGSADGSVRVWSSSTGEELVKWLGHADAPAVVRWAPRRMMVASACSALALWLPDMDKIGGIRATP